MSTDIGSQTVTYPRAATTVIRKNRFVEVNSSGNVEEISTAGNLPDGVSAEETTATSLEQGISVYTFNGQVIVVEAGDAIPAGSMVASDNMGRAVVATSASDRVIGPAKTAATAAGDLIQVSATVASNS